MEHLPQTLRSSSLQTSSTVKTASAAKDTNVDDKPLNGNATNGVSATLDRAQKLWAEETRSNDLHAELTKFNAIEAATKEKKTTYEDKLQVAGQQLLDLHKAQSDFNDSKEAAENSVVQVGYELATLETAKKDQGRRLKQLEEDQKLINTNRAHLESEIAEVSAQHSQLTAKNADNEAVVASLTAKLEATDTQLAELRVERQAIADNLTKLEEGLAHIAQAKMKLYGAL